VLLLKLKRFMPKSPYGELADVERCGIFNAKDIYIGKSTDRDEACREIK
jgi:hypothetical protein